MNKGHTFITDLHGDVDATKVSLQQAGVIEPFDLTKIEPEIKRVNNDVLVIMGDLIDRGPQNPEMMDFVVELQKVFGEDIKLLLGNHDWMFHKALSVHNYHDITSPLYRDALIDWLTNGGAVFCKQHAERHQLSFSSMDTVQFMKNLIAGDSRYDERVVMSSWNGKVKDGSLEGLNFPSIIQHMSETYLCKPHINTYAQMKIAYSPAPGVIAVHASVQAKDAKEANEDSVARLGVEASNMIFENIKWGDSAFVEMSPLVHGAIWNRESYACNYPADVLENLKGHHISLVLLGHTPNLGGDFKFSMHDDGVYQCFLDNAISRGFSTRAAWSYARLNECGKFYVHSSEQPFMHVGTMDGTQFEPSQELLDL